MSPTARAGLLAGGIIMSALVLCGVAAALLSGGSAATSHGGVTAAQPVAGDPWPECAAARDWFRTHLDDTAGFEVIEWGRREVTPADAKGIFGPVKKGDVSFRVKFRAKNQYGGLQVAGRVFRFRGGKILMVYEDLTTLP